MRKRLLGVCAVLGGAVFLAVPPAVVTRSVADELQSPWPTFRGNARRTGFSSVVGPSEPVLAWALDVPGAIVSSPVIGADGTIYIGAGDRALHAVNPDGTERWVFPVGSAEEDYVDAPPVLGQDGTIYVASVYGRFVAVNPDGTLRWEAALSFLIASSAAVAADGTVYVGTHGGEIHAFDADGASKWTTTLPAGPVAGAPAIADDGTVYISASDGRLYALLPDGSVDWSLDLGGANAGDILRHNTPAIASSGTIYVAAGGDLVAVAASGVESWRFRTEGGAGAVCSAAVAADGTVHIGDDGGQLYAVRPDGTLKWQYNVQWTSIRSSPVVDAAGTVFFGNGSSTSNEKQGSIWALNADGTLAWQLEVPQEIERSSPAIGPDGTLYIGSWNDLTGQVYAVTGAAAPEPAGALAPTKVQVKVNAQNAAKHRLHVAALCDSGLAGQDLSGPVTLTIGDRTYELPGLTAKGKRWSYRSDTLRLKVKQSGIGSSRGSLSVVLQGPDVSGIAPDDRLALSLSAGAVRSAGAVLLTRGKFSQKKSAWGVAGPDLFVRSANAVFKGAGKDRLTLNLGVVVDESALQTAPDLTVWFGGVEHSISAGSFAKKKDKWIAKRSADQPFVVSIDPARATLVLQGRKLDLGTTADGEQAVTISIDLDGDRREVEVLMVRSGKSMRY